MTPDKENSMDIDSRAPEGNAYVIMATVHRLLRETGRFDEWPGIKTRMQSGDYNNACDVAEEVSFGSIRVVNR
jgi:hypothetical protein